jgi:DnaJ family protein C protein 8
MVTKPEKADDDIDALEALESEEKEYLKVSLPRPSTK